LEGVWPTIAIYTQKGLNKRQELDVLTPVCSGLDTPLMSRSCATVNKGVQAFSEPFACK
jgi:hypothetical protein